MERELWSYLKQAQKPIVLYGMGNGADKIINVLKSYDIEFHGVFASDGFVRNKQFHGHTISTYHEMKEKFGQMIVLLCFGSSLPPVIENIKKIASEQELYAPEVPVIGDGLFTLDYYNQNKEAFDWVYSHLADEISKKTFENIIKYKISGKINYLLECEVNNDEPYCNLVKPHSESFLDLGAYNGDTVSEFVTHCPNYSKITAVEPDVKTFKKLQNNTQNLRDVTLYNACISDKCSLLPFDMRGGRNSALSDAGTLLKSITIDSLKLDATYIKMDVEGAEIEAILGGKQTIIDHKPKMLISAYHRTDDLIKIPQTVLGIRDDYKIYLRHFNYLPAWDTNFYFI